MVKAEGIPCIHISIRAFQTFLSLLVISCLFSSLHGPSRKATSFLLQRSNSGLEVADPEAEGLSVADVKMGY